MANLRETASQLGALAIIGLLFVAGLSPRVYGQRGQGQRGQEQYSRQQDNGRSLVSRTQSDLQQAARSNRASGKQRERYDNARNHLSRFDRDLSQGRFNKDLLDGAIEDVKNVVNNNTLSARDRDRLNEDLQQLRNLRASRGASY